MSTMGRTPARRVGSAGSRWHSVGAAPGRLTRLHAALADGMCQEKCPVKINTGELIKQLRSDEMAEAPRASAVAMVRERAPHHTLRARRSSRACSPLWRAVFGQQLWRGGLDHEQAAQHGQRRALGAGPLAAGGDQRRAQPLVRPHGAQLEPLHAQGVRG